MIERIAVTQEFIGDALASVSKKEKVNHPALNFFGDALYNGVYKLIHCRAHRFKSTVRDPEKDLFQSSWEHIFERIYKYDSRRGKFSTWSFKTITNHLMQYYNAEKKRFSRESEMHDNPENQAGSELMCENNIVHHASNHLLRQEIAATVSSLILKYPKHAGITIGLFGSPEEIMLKRKFPETIVLRNVKGFKREEKETFYQDYIVPAFKERFGGIYA